MRSTSRWWICCRSASKVTEVLPGPIDLGKTFLVGIGAIGHGANWALRRMANLRGLLYLVDGEAYDDSNPQRYVGIAFNASGA